MSYQRILRYCIAAACISITFCTEYLIITGPALLPAAESISDMHSAEVQETDRLTTEIVTTDEISGLYPDLALSEAVRQTVIDFIDSDPELSYLLLLGDETFLPPIYDWYGNPSDDFYSSENEYQAFPRLGTGRIPAADLEQAIQITDKIRDYTLTPDITNWRHKMLLFADDAYKAGGGDFNTEITHVSHSDAVYQLLKADINIQCLYGTDYIPQPGPAWQTLPEMTADVIQTHNSGVAWINYIGHGNEITLADEIIINMERDLDLLQAPSDQQPVWVIGSCDFGHYDNAECMSEALLLKPDGAIALITPTREVLTTVIANFSNRLYQNIQDYIRGLNEYRLGTLLAGSKAGGTEYHYHCLGDPAMKLPFQRAADVDIVYDQIMQPLNQYHLERMENPETDAHLFVKECDRSMHRSYGDAELDYQLPGRLIYEGNFSTSVQFFPPVNLTTGDSCQPTLFLTIPNESDAGVLTAVMDVTALDNENLPVDTEGPDIEFLSDGVQLTDLTLVDLPLELQILISDDVGINITGEPGHAIRTRCSQEDWISRTDEFQYLAGSSTSGELFLTFESLPDGLQTLRLEVWDNANNVTSRSVQFCISDCTPQDLPDDSGWNTFLSILSPASVHILNSSEILCSTSGGMVSFNTASEDFEIINDELDLDYLDISTAAPDPFGCFWSGGSDPLGIIQIFHPELGLQNSFSHLDFHEVTRFIHGNDRSFAICRRDLDWGIAEFRRDAENSPIYYDFYRNFPMQVSVILDIDILGNWIYLTTPEGLIKADCVNQILSSDDSWQQDAEGLQPRQFVSDNAPFIVTSSEIYVSDENGYWSLFYGGLSGSVIDAGLVLDESRLAVLTESQYYEFALESGLMDGFPISGSAAGGFRCFDRNTNLLVLGIENQGLMTVDNDLNTEIHHPNTVFQNNFSAVTILADGGMAGVSREGVFYRNEDQIINFIPENTSESFPLNDMNPGNFSAVPVDYVVGSNQPLGIEETGTGNILFGNSGLAPSDPNTRGGIIEIDPVSFEVTVWDTTDGILDGLAGIYNQYWTNRYLTINRLVRDPTGNIWVMNPYSEIYNHPAAILNADGNAWNHVTAPDFEAHLPQDVAFDSQNRAWIGFKFDFPMNNFVDEYANGGIRVVDWNQTIDDESDDVWYSVSNPDIFPSETIWSLTIDDGDRLWILTGSGIQVFTGEFSDAEITLTPASDTPMLSYLPFYKGDCIRTGPGGNVWVTTRHSGCYVIRPDLSFWPDQFGLRFGNSGLLSDIVNDISFSADGDKAVLSTSKGISELDMSLIPSVSPVPDGDIDGDGNTDVTDIVLLIWIILGNEEPDEYFPEAADMNLDGILDVLDVVMIVTQIMDTAARNLPLTDAEMHIEGDLVMLKSRGGVAWIRLLTENAFSGACKDEYYLPETWIAASGPNGILAIAADGQALANWNGPIFSVEHPELLTEAEVVDFYGRRITIDLHPSSFKLLDPYPNPFNSTVTLEFEIPESSQSKLTVINILGQEVDAVVDEKLDAGRYRFRYRADHLATGMYFLKLETSNRAILKKMVLIK